MTRRLATMLLCLSAGSLAGCYRAHLCGEEERCNLFDDDCDGLVDEGFVATDGAYRSTENCGTCGIDCRAVFPTAESVACDDSSDGPICRLVSCARGEHLAGAGACEPDVHQPSSLAVACAGDRGRATLHPRLGTGRAHLCRHVRPGVERISMERFDAERPTSNRSPATRWRWVGLWQFEDLAKILRRGAERLCQE